MTSCMHIREELKAFADGELTGAIRSRVSRHVAGCPACTRDLEEIRSLTRTLRTLDTAVPPPELRSRILSEIPIIERSHEPVRAVWWRMPALGLGTAAAALFLFIAVAPRAHRMESDLESAREASAPVPLSFPANPQVRSEARTGRKKAKPARPPAPKSTDPDVPAPAVSGSMAAKLPASATPGIPAEIARPITPSSKPRSVDEMDRKDKTEMSAGIGEAVAEPRSVPLKSDSFGGVAPPAIIQTAPPAPQGLGGGQGGGALGAAPSQASDSALAENQRGVRAQSDIASKVTLEQNALRMEVLEVTHQDVQAAANRIITAVQDAGGKPTLPEKPAENGAAGLVVSFVLPASKIEAIKSLLSDRRPEGNANSGNVTQQLGVFRERKLGQNSPVDNRMYFGYLAPEITKQTRAGGFQRNLSGSARENSLFKLQSEPAPGNKEEEQVKAARPGQPLARQSAMKANVRDIGAAFRQANNRAGEELVRLIVKLRTPPKPAQAPKRGED